MESPSQRLNFNNDEERTVQGFDEDTQKALVPRLPSPSITHAPVQMSYTIQERLPPELLLHILHARIGPQRISVEENKHLLTSQHFTISYTPCEDSSADTHIFSTSEFPPYLISEYSRFRARAWLLDIKSFNHPTDFYISHYLLSTGALNHVPAYDLPDGPWSIMQDWTSISCSITFPITSARTMVPHLSSLHGVEKIRLDFNAEEYFTLFDVSIPPFHYSDPERGDNLHPDPLLHGAAVFLKHTRVLELHFGDKYKWAHPWSNVHEHGWEEARSRPHICDSGIVVDWILEHAWDAGVLQHLEALSITGDVQSWVLDKWNGIFLAHRLYIKDHPEDVDNPFVVYKPDVEAISSLGLPRENEDAEWYPELHYPPVCSCKIACERLVGGEILDEVQEKSWEDFDVYPEYPVGSWASMDGWSGQDALFALHVREHEDWGFFGNGDG